jgi:protein-tyrosine phosphatase
MDFCSLVYENMIAFGPYPLQEQVDILVDNDFTVFVDLTDFQDIRYNAPISIRYPIQDGNIPVGSIRELIDKVIDFLDEGYRVYIHCEHGRGRSVLLTACVLASVQNLDYDETIEILNTAHRNGHGNSAKWKSKTIPPHSCQRYFLRGFIAGLDSIPNM